MADEEFGLLLRMLACCYDEEAGTSGPRQTYLLLGNFLNT